jgi:hypothetical protein
MTIDISKLSPRLQNKIKEDIETILYNEYRITSSFLSDYYTGSKDNKFYLEIKSWSDACAELMEKINS